MSRLRDNRGFSLIEVLLSVAIISLLTGISAPVYASFQIRNDLDIAAQSIADMLRRAQTYSRGVNGDSQWGVAIQGGSATLFKGASYAGRDAAYDEVSAIPNSIAVSGLAEVPFTKLDATPTTTGSVTLTTSTNEVRTITINAKGMVTY